MTKVLSYNVPLDSNLSYAHVFNRAIEYTKDIDWYYGAYGYNGSMIKRENYTLVPCVPHPANHMPQQIHQTIKEVKPDLLIMHEDMQRIQWIPEIKEIPTVLWIPWDNEDMQSIKQASALMNACDVPILVNKFSQKLFKQFGVNAKQIYNAVDTKVYYKDEQAGQEFRQRLKIPDGHKLLTWVGRAGWRKRFSHVIEIFSRIRAKDPTVHLYLHTDFNDPANQFQPEEILWAKGMLKSDAVYYPGDLHFATGFPSNIMRGIYNATDIYISPAGGEGMCVIKGTSVLTDEGFKPIEEIKIGDKVYNKSGIVNVTDTFVREYKGKGIKIERYYDTEPLVCTEDHKILVYTLIRRNRNGVPHEYMKGWKCAKDIDVEKDYLYIPKLHDLKDISTPEIPFSGKNMWWLIGLYIAEGCTRDREIFLCLHKDELDHVESMIEELIIIKNNSNQFGYSEDYEGNIKIRTSIDGNKGLLSFSSIYTAEFFKRFGNKAYLKHIPDDIFKYLCSNSDARKEFIDGLYYGDGDSNLHFKNETTESYSLEMVSEKLLTQLQFLLQLDGTFASLVKSREERKEFIRGIEYNCHETWRLRWSSNQKFAIPVEECNIINDEVEDGYLLKIKHKTVVDLNEPVYNLEVGYPDFDGHSYITRQGCIHNCLPLVESLACEVPFISTDYSTTQELAGYPKRDMDMMGTRGIGVRMGYMFRDKGIMRPYVDIDDFVIKTVNLLADDKRRKEMGRAGKQFVDEEVSCQVVGRKLYDVFKDISEVNTEKVKF